MPIFPCRRTRSAVFLLFSLTTLSLLLPLAEARANFVAPEENRKESALPNHGLVVCAPRLKGTTTTTGNTTDLDAFADACGLYLAVTVGGRPEFSRTPALSSVDRVRRQRGFANLRLEPGEAAQIAARTGATLTAVGEIQETGETVSLSYQFYTTKGVPIKNPVRMQGTRATIVQRLPQFSNQMAGLLGVKSLPAPQVKASVGQMVQLGQSLPQQKRFSADQEQTLATLRKEVPLAALVYLSTQDDHLPSTTFDAAAKTAVEGFPDNALVFSHFGSKWAEKLAPYKARIVALIARYPRNYALTTSLVWYSRHAKDNTREIMMARRLVQIAPQNPDAWLTAGSTVSDVADRIRQGKIISKMTEAELAAVEKIYPEWLDMVAHAVEMDPQFAHAWLRVSVAASFEGNREVSVKAWERAKQLGEEPIDLYWWGLQLFQEKWGGSAEELALVARESSEGDYLNSGQAGEIAGTLKVLGFDADVSRLLVRRFPK